MALTFNHPKSNKCPTGLGPSPPDSLALEPLHPPNDCCHALPRYVQKGPMVGVQHSGWIGPHTMLNPPALALNAGEAYF